MSYGLHHVSDVVVFATHAATHSLCASVPGEHVQQTVPGWTHAHSRSPGAQAGAPSMPASTFTAPSTSGVASSSAPPLQAAIVNTAAIRIARMGIHAAHDRPGAQDHTGGVTNV